MNSPSKGFIPYNYMGPRIERGSLRKIREIQCDKCRKASRWETRQSGCEFCTERSVIELAADAGANLYMRIANDSYLGFEGFDSYGAVVFYEATINYCPMCGRKL